MSNVLILLLSHRPAAELSRTLNVWKNFLPADSILLAYGGDPRSFPQIDFEQKVFIEDPQLRRRDQQRELQSLIGVFHAAREFLAQKSQFQYVYVVEYDQIPLIADLPQRLRARLEREGADVLAHHLHRIDGTSNSHYLYHARDRRFHEFFASISKRSNKRVILSMLGTGSFWRRSAFESVAAREKPFPIYLELYLPTLAHHLGFRLRDMPDQNRFVLPLGERGAEIEEARSQGAWTLHPVKKLLGGVESTLP